MVYRGFSIETDNDSNLKMVKHPSRGSVPKSLRGLYTSDHSAESAIDTVLNARAKPNGKAK